VPIYEYQCEKCKRTFEYMQSMSDAPKKKCERCGGKLDKLLSAAGFVLKGGGWYKDLYASSKPESAASEAPAASKAEAKADAKADAKGDAKPDAKTDKVEARAEKAARPEISSLGRAAAPASKKARAAKGKR
jgi:putative FmdB family regulatory protein